jgi:arylsulfatase A
MVGNPYDTNDPNEYIESHYKNPILYENGVTTNYTNNEYGEDLLRNYFFNFIDTSVAKHKKFFGLWTTNLGHTPFQATPDDSDYLTAPLTSNVKYFPSMIKYLDKEIGLLLKHLDSLGVSERTYIFFTADNGTNQSIASLWRNQQVQGGKGKTVYSWGTHVPFIVYKKNSGIIKVDSSIIDFSDIIPTLSEMVNHPLPLGQTFDGVSFWQQIQGLVNDSARKWSFTEFHPQPITLPHRWSRWVEDKNFKRYDTASLPKNKNHMFNVHNDSLESHYVKKFTPCLTKKNSDFGQILSTMKN